MGQVEILFSILLGVSAFALVYKGIPILINIAEAKRLLDLPMDERKIHFVGVPALGGVAIIAAIWLTFSLHPASETMQGYSTLLSASIVIFIVGLKDDLFVMDPFKKLVAQIASSLFVILGGGVTIESFGGVFGIASIPYPVSIAITLFTMVVVINAVNLIDGIDGLAGTISILAALFFGAWFWQAGLYGEAVFATIFVCAMGGFLVHNWERATIFMGDTGALLSGLYLSVLGVRFLNSALALPDINFWQDSAPVLLVAALIVPLYDTLRVFMLRVGNGSSPFDADAEHVHHQLLNMGLSHQQVTLTLAGCQVVIVGSAIGLSPFLGVNALLGAVIVISLLVFPTLSFKRKALAVTPLGDIIESQLQTNGKSNGEAEEDMEPVLEPINSEQDFEEEDHPEVVEVINSKLG